MSFSNKSWLILANKQVDSSAFARPAILMVLTLVVALSLFLPNRVFASAFVLHSDFAQSDMGSSNNFGIATSKLNYALASDDVSTGIKHVQAVKTSLENNKASYLDASTYDDTNDSSNENSYGLNARHAYTISGASFHAGLSNSSSYGLGGVSHDSYNKSLANVSYGDNLGSSFKKVSASDNVSSEGAADSSTSASSSSSDASSSSQSSAVDNNAALNAKRQNSASDTYEDKALVSCIESFNETRDRVLATSTQSVILLSNSQGIVPFISLQSPGAKGAHYALWQTLNGEVKGYALRNGKGFDYANSAGTPAPLSWHPTLIWDNLFGSSLPLKNYSCVLTGRTRVMGKRVSLIRLIPQESLRYSFIIAKEDESDFPVELSILDSKGTVISRLTTMDSRIIAGFDFPIGDEVYDRIAAANEEHDANLHSSNLSVSDMSQRKANANSSQTKGPSESATNVRNEDVSSNQSIDQLSSSDESVSDGTSGAGINDYHSKALAANDAPPKLGSENIYGLTSTYHDVSPVASPGHTNSSFIADKKESSLRVEKNLSKDDQSSGLAELVRSNEEQMSANNKTQQEMGSLSGELAKPQAQVANNLSKVKIWPELNIPKVYKLTATGFYPSAGEQCIYQEFSDGLTSFRVYRNTKSKIYYPVISNGTLTLFRKNSSNYEYSVVGEVPLNLAEFVLTKISVR